MEIRTHDQWGSGGWLASRGNRPHLGIDLVVMPGEEVRAPFDLTIQRIAFPYDGDLNYKGIKFSTILNGENYTGRLFYFTPYTTSGFYKKGEAVGIAQDLTTRYPNITNHVHLDIRNVNSYDIDNEYLYQGVYYTNPQIYI